jgi:hypothetical protein
MARKQAEPPVTGSPADHRTADRLLVFLSRYTSSGSMTRAARQAKISLDLHYEQLAADPEYRRAFEAAQRQMVDGLEAEAFAERAGSDELLLFLVRAWRPDRYREHVIQELSGSIKLKEPGTSASRGAVAQLIAIARERVQ